jgi:hypothetical protein
LNIKNIGIIVFIVFIHNLFATSHLPLENITSWRIWASVEDYNYGIGFSSDGKVFGQKGFKHLTIEDDSFPSSFGDTLYKLACKVVMKVRSVNRLDGKHTYTIIIELFDGDSCETYVYSTTRCKGFDDLPLQKLQILIDMNTVFSPHFQKKWQTDYIIKPKDLNEIDNCEKSQARADSIYKAALRERDNQTINFKEKSENKIDEELEKLKKELQGSE